MNYKDYESKNWDLNISLEELVKYNEGVCLIKINYVRHKSDDCFGRFQLYFKHPDKPHKGYETMIGVTNDGLCYTGDGGIRENYKFINVDKAILFMDKYKDFMNTTSEFESSLRTICEEDCVNIIISHNYGIQYDKAKPLHYANQKLPFAIVKNKFQEVK